MAGVNELIARLERLERGEVYQRMGQKMADAAHAACIEGFKAERDPYGAPWKKRKPPAAWAVLRFGIVDNGHKLLDDTGKMIDSLTARYMRGTIVMRIKGYAKFHQSGTRFMVARKIFPEQTRGLGLWGDPLQRAATDAVRELMK